MGPQSRYRRLSDLPEKIPVFPLHGSILLPRAKLPLNVFEPRYLEMLDYVMSGQRMIGIIQPQATDIEEESPQEATALKSVGCAGRVTAYQELDDGRLVISLFGIARFRSRFEENTSHPFRILSVDYAEFAHDLSAGSGEDDVDREHLLEVLRAYLDAKDLEADWNAVNNAATELLVNSLSTISPFGPEEKQALLEARTLKERAEVLSTLATMELATDDRSGGGVQ
ncbi:MAG: LON peptidase substrate-binding domain-containing protein [Hyphomicrobiaceae bacterium]